jgi:hypothetical protein
VHKSVLKVVLSARRNFCGAKLLLDVMLDAKWLRARVKPRCNSKPRC